MALSKKEYVELGRLRDSLDLTDTTSDSELEFAIRAASRFVDRYCSRKFWYEEENVEFVPGGGQPFLVLARCPVWSVAEVKNRLTDATRDLTDSMIETYSGILHLNEGVPTQAWRHNNVSQNFNYVTEQPVWQVTYAGGYTTPVQDDVAGVDKLPEDLAMATQMIATNIYESRGQDLRIRRLHVLEAAVWYHEGGIEVGVEAMLNQFRRAGI